MTLGLIIAGTLAAAHVGPAESLESEGSERTFFVAGETGKSTPAIIVLHGGGGSGAQVKKTLGPLPAGFAWVFPDGVDGHWNDGREDLRSTDDVAFLEALVEKLGDEGRIDASRAFVAGISNGGMMAMRMACEAPDVTKGIAVVASAAPAGLQCPNGRPLAAMLIHGTADPLILVEGGKVGKQRRWMKDRGETVSISATLDHLSTINRCDGKGAAIDAPDIANDGMTTRYFRYESCAAALVFVEVENGGHGWPGDRKRRLLERITGPNTADFDATPLISEFFRTGALDFEPPARRD